MAEPIVLGRFHFATRMAARDHIRSILVEKILYEEFESEVLADLIAGHHDYCSAVGLRPLRFRKGAAPESKGGYEFQAFFLELGWHGVSWVKSLKVDDPYRRFRDSLRRRVRPLIDKARGQACERCGRSGGLHVDHEDPTFDGMARQAFAKTSPEEVRAWSRQTWKIEERFSLPEGHPALVEFDSLHAHARLRTLCRPCHAEVTFRGEEGGDRTPPPPSSSPSGGGP